MTLISVMRNYADVEIPQALFFMSWAMEDICFLVFLSIIFGLQAMVIIMEEQNDT